MTELDPRNATLLKQHVLAETAFDMPGTLATLTADCVFEDVATGESFHGHEGVRVYYSQWWSAFGNVPAHSKLYVPAHDKLIVETRFVGTHRGAYGGIAPSGHAIDLPVAIFVSFRDGLMSGERFYYDRATLLSQISAAK
jgi:steroid delta-isomerase-like uncharacterized protein